MSYIEGFVIPVPTANKDRFIAYAREIDPIFLEYGAKRVWECWGDEVQHGKQTDFFRAVEAKDDETVCFSWIEWPDKATRDAQMAALMDPMENDPRFDQEQNPVPFDGKRMIFGGFQPVVALGE